MALGAKSKMAAGIFKPFFLVTVFTTCLITLLILDITECSEFWDRYSPQGEHVRDTVDSINSASKRDIDEVDHIKQRVINTAPFEIGYIVQILQDKYRKMVDKYVTCKDLVTYHHWLFEMVIYLEEIEHGYWQIEHIVNMLHEVEKKFNIHTTLKEKHKDLSRQELIDAARAASASPRPGHKPQSSKVSKPLNETILDAAPWSIKLMMLKDMVPTTTMAPFHYSARRVGVEALVQRRQDLPSVTGAIGSPDNDDDENNMRLKLFRLMYETVRDSDLKVKRAELIRKHYTNSSAFEVGFLMGEVQEKFDIIQEFSGTLQKFYDTWKPIEHINAYEQIANYAIQVNHLVDLVRTIAKNST